MDKKVIERFKGFLTNNGARQLFEGFVRQFGHEKDVNTYLTEQNETIMAVSQAFEFDKIPETVIDFRKLSDRWIRVCVNNRFDAKVNALIDQYGVEETMKAIDEYKTDEKFYCYSTEYLQQLQAEKERKDINIIKAHLVKVKSTGSETAKTTQPKKKEFTPATGGGDDGDFEFLTFKRPQQGNIDDYHVMLKSAKKNAYVKFNAHISELIRKYDLYYVRIRLDKQTGDVHFIFQDEDTADSIKCMTRNGNSAVYLNSKAVVEWIMKRYGIEGEQYELSVTKNLSKTKDYITIKINE